MLLSSAGASNAAGIPLNMYLDLERLGYEPWVRDQAIRLGFTKAWVASHPVELERFLAVRLAAPPSLEVYLRHGIGRQAFNLGARITDIRAPTLVMVGEDEDHGPPGHITHCFFARSLAKEIPNARFVMLPGQGHYYYYLDPQARHSAMRAFFETT